MHIHSIAVKVLATSSVISKKSPVSQCFSDSWLTRAWPFFLHRCASDPPRRKTTLPGEYGADAFNADKNGEDQESQAKATRQLTETFLQSSRSSKQGRIINKHKFWAGHFGIFLYMNMAKPDCFFIVVQEPGFTQSHQTDWRFVALDWQKFNHLRFTLKFLRKRSSVRVLFWVAPCQHVALGASPCLSKHMLTII